MSKDRLPPLNQLRVFAAAAKHLSFKAAAEELFVTAPAVSRQIKLLEQHLEVKLFERLNREVVLTKAGKHYFDDVERALEILNKATEGVRRQQPEKRFIINTLPSIMSLMLVPNIHEFQAQFPEYNIQLESDTGRADFHSGEVDVAIRHQHGGEPELYYSFLDTVSVSPICSPEYLQQNPRLAQGDLSNARLIRLTADPYNWTLWLKEWGVKKPDNEILLNSFHASLEATKNSIGIAMGYVPLVRKHVARGEFAMPMPDKISNYGKMYFVCKEEKQQDEIFVAFEQWLKALMVTEWPDHQNPEKAKITNVSS